MTLFMQVKVSLEKDMVTVLAAEKHSCIRLVIDEIYLRLFLCI